ncbi:MAG: 23S rRNA (uracil-C(5))-methyltransferase RlmCD [Pelotomaculum sp. PtaB.Bin104]|nr:MAG: 23S rRNA (uracil-C(5))-methyltransferase RlmCD [Pelotomaculum sp. PtaB.Bin104]
MGKDLPLQKGIKVDIDITSLNHSGEGVGRYRGIAVFVPFTAPGDKVLAEITELKKNFARGRLISISESSQWRCKPACAIFSRCGGCRLQHLDYQEQLRRKTVMVKDSLARIGHLSTAVVKTTIGMENSWHYRNKVSYHVEEKEGQAILGFYEKGTHQLACYDAGCEVVQSLPWRQADKNTAGCLLVSEKLRKIAGLIEKLLNECQAGGDERVRCRGWLRQVILREAFATGECMVVLVPGADKWPAEKTFVMKLLKSCPEIASIQKLINKNPAKAGFGGTAIVLAGKEFITERLGNLTFRISARSFFQVNPVQASLLYRIALDYAGLSGRETVVDAYSGTGTIALFLAENADRVYGLESISGAVEDARANAVLNGITNAEFRCGEVEKLLPGMAAQGLHPEVIVLDPPRRGCGVAALNAVIAMKTPRVVYISCDPGTLARDLGYLADKGYRVEEVQPVDMFPWTAHIEAVACLERKHNDKL